LIFNPNGKGFYLVRIKFVNKERELPGFACKESGIPYTVIIERKNLFFP